MRKTILAVLASCLFLPSVFAEDTTTLGKQFFEMIDLTAPGLENVKHSHESGNCSAALDAYRDVLLENLKQRDWFWMVPRSRCRISSSRLKTGK